MPKPNRGGSAGNPLPKAIGALAMAAVLVVAYFAQFVWFPDGISVTTAESESGQEISSIAATSDIVINEVMGSNSSAFSDENGAFPDYVELLNTGSAPADLNGLVLTDKLNSNSQFVFPSHVLQPGETVLVFCDDGNANAYGSPTTRRLRSVLRRHGDAVQRKRHRNRDCLYVYLLRERGLHAR